MLEISKGKVKIEIHVYLAIKLYLTKIWYYIDSNIAGNDSKIAGTDSEFTGTDSECVGCETSP